MILKQSQSPRKKNTISVITFRGTVLFISLILNFTLFSMPFTADASTPIITSSTIASGIAGASFTYTITASNTPTSFSATTLPSGLTINTSTGVISGTPTIAGNFIDTVSAINGSGTGTQILNIVIISAWSLTGNAGTSPGTNYIGTTDNKDLYFTMDSQHAGRLNNSSLLTSFGVNCLNYNTSGYGNTGFGTNVLFGISTGTNNSSFGANSLYHSNGSYNTAMGYLSLYNSTKAYSNTAVGCSSSFNDTTGIDNTAVGDSSLYTNISGSNNTAVGYKADVSTNNVSYAIALGYKASANSNQFALSDSIHTIKAVGLPTGAGYVLTDVSGNGNLSLQPNAATGISWSLTGNSGTNPSTNFIGTTDYKDVVFKRGGTIAGLLDSSLFNTSIGVDAFKNNTTGVYNSGFGFNALASNTTGNNNTSLGYAALGNNRSGNDNTAIGYQANVTDTSDSYAISIGYNATAISNQLALSDSIHTIKAKGLSTGAGYVLTDVSGNGNLSLQPIAGGTTAWSLSGNTPTSGISYIGSSNNVSLRFRTHNIERMTIDSIGRVGIGTTNIADTSYNLYVEKGISTRKVKVNVASWSDYVFDTDYKLSSLIDVENYIKQNKHLPDVPSAIEVEKNGIDLGNNQKILLQKIEELTLYIIDQNKKIEELQNQNDQLQELKKEVDDLKKSLQKNE